MNDLVPVVCPFCGVGCGMYLQLLDDGSVATLPSRNDPISEGRLCIRGWRAGDLLVNSERLTSPQVGGEPTSWTEALQQASQLLTGMGGSRVGILAAGHLTNEEGFALNHFGREVLGTAHLDNFGRLIDGPALWALERSYGQAYRRPGLNTLPDYDLLLCLNSNLRELNDEAGAWVHKARTAGSKLIVIDAVDDGLGQDGQLYVQHRPDAQAAVLQELSRQLANETESLPSPDVGELGPAELADQLREAVDLIAAADRIAIVFSTRAIPTPEAAVAGEIAKQINETSNQQAEVFAIAGTPNSLGLIHMGLLPDQSGPGGEGLGLSEMLAPEQDALDGLIVVGEDLSGWIGEEALQALKDNLDAFIVIDSVSTPSTQLADVALPMAGFGEKEGSYTQLSGEVCWSGAAVSPPGEGRPLPMILAQLTEGPDGTAGPVETEAIWQQINQQLSGYEQIELAALRREGRVMLGPTTPLPQSNEIELDYQFQIGQAAEDGYTLISRYDGNWWILDGRVPAIAALHREARDWQAGYALMNPGDMKESEIRPGRSAPIQTAQGSEELTIYEHSGVPTGYIVLPAHQLELIRRLMGPGQYERQSSSVSRAPVFAELKKG